MNLHMRAQGVSPSGKRTFVVKAIDTVDRRALVVAAKNKKVFGVLDLVRLRRNGTTLKMTTV